MGKFEHNSDASEEFDLAFWSGASWPTLSGTSCIQIGYFISGQGFEPFNLNLICVAHTAKNFPFLWVQPQLCLNSTGTIIAAIFSPIIMILQIKQKIIK